MEIVHYNTTGKILTGGKIGVYEVLKEFKGKDLVGITYEQLLPYVLPNDNPEQRI